MKNFRFLLAAAVMIAVGSAFTNAPENKNDDANWYLPLSDMPPGSAAAQNFNNYDHDSASEAPPSCNDAPTKVCAAQFVTTSAPSQIKTRN